MVRSVILSPSEVLFEDCEYPVMFFVFVAIRLLASVICSVDFFDIFGLTSPWWNIFVGMEYTFTLTAVATVVLKADPLLFKPFFWIVKFKTLVNNSLFVACSMGIAMSRMSPKGFYIYHGALINRMDVLAYFWIQHALVLLAQLAMVVECMGVREFLEDEQEIKELIRARVRVANAPPPPYEAPPPAYETLDVECQTE